MVVRCNIVGKEAKVCTNLATQNPGYTEQEIEVGVDVYSRQWKCLFISAVLIGNLVVPMYYLP
jgi:hypothetical protein